MKERGSYPGFAIKTSDNKWLGEGHGYLLSTDAFYAEVFNTAKEAIDFATQAQVDFQFTYDIVAAWEPVCEKLRHQISELEEVNTIKPNDLLDISLELISIISKLKVLV
jgi:hypothetical protein